MNPIFESPRLLFREFADSEPDARLIVQLNSDPEVLKYLHEHPTNTLEKALAALRGRIIPQYKNYGYGRWAVHTRHNGAFIGWCGLKFRPERSETDLGYRFIKSAWGQGYATEAARATLDYGFGKCNLATIGAVAQTGNIASLKVIEKCGMQFVRFGMIDGFAVKIYRLQNPFNTANH